MLVTQESKILPDRGDTRSKRAVLGEVLRGVFNICHSAAI